MSASPVGAASVVAWSAVAGLAAATAGVTPALVAGREPERLFLVWSMLAWLWFLSVFPSGRVEPSWVWLVLGVSAVGVLAGSAVAFIIGFAVLTATQLWRYSRRASVPERQATKWLLLGLIPACGLFLGVGAISALPEGPRWVLDHPAYTVASLSGMWVVPVSAVAGLTLLDRGPVDELVRWFIVAVTTVAGVAAVHTLASPWPRGLAAAVACASVIPMAFLSDRVATRLAYSRGPQRALKALPHRLAAATDAGQVAPVVALAVREALASPGAQVRMGPQVLASSGEDHDSANGVPVVLHDDEVATLTAAVRPGEVALSSRDRQILRDIAVIAAPALAGVRAARAAEEAHQHAARIRERERDRLHADLHDEIGPALSGLAMTAAAISTRLTGNDVATAQRLTEDLRAGIGTTAIRMRELAYDLRPQEEADRSLATTLLSRLGGQSPPTLTIDVDPKDLRLPDDAQLAVTRVVLEAVTNVRRHAAASTCAVDIRMSGQDVRVIVDDDGVGVAETVGRHRAGIGLGSITQRTAAFGGTCHLAARPGGGSRLTATFVLPGRVAP